MAATPSATDIKDSSRSSTRSRRRYSPDGQSTPFWTTSSPTNTKRSKTGGEYRHWNFHYTPISFSRMKAVEDFLQKLARRRLRRGSTIPSRISIHRLWTSSNCTTRRRRSRSNSQQARDGSSPPPKSVLNDKDPPLAIHAKPRYCCSTPMEQA